MLQKKNDNCTSGTPRNLLHHELGEDPPPQTKLLDHDNSFNNIAITAISATSRNDSKVEHHDVVVHRSRRLLQKWRILFFFFFFSIMLEWFILYNVTLTIQDTTIQQNDEESILLENDHKKGPSHASSHDVHVSNNDKDDILKQFQRSLFTTNTQDDERKLSNQTTIPLSYFQIGKLPSNITIRAMEHLYKLQDLPKEYIHEILYNSCEYLRSLPSVITIKLQAEEDEHDEQESLSKNNTNNTAHQSNTTINTKHHNPHQKHNFSTNHPTNITIVGDTHGKLYGVIHIFQLYNFPTSTSPYIFNGDIFDKGNFSFQIFISLLMIQLSCPTCIYFTRGNHELFEGRKKQLEDYVYRVYGEDIYDLLVATIREIPIAVVIEGRKYHHRSSMNDGSISSRMDSSTWNNGNKHNNAKSEAKIDTGIETTVTKDHSINKFGRAIVLHAGIPVTNLTIQDIQNIHRGKDPHQSSLFYHLLWADPQSKNGINKISSRGYRFGPDVTHSFLDNNHLDFMIRGHNYVFNGLRKAHDDRLITVYSAPTGSSHHQGAILTVDVNMGLYKGLFQAAPYPIVDDWSSFAIY